MRKIGLAFFMTIFLVLIIPGFITIFFAGSFEYDLTEPIARISPEGEEQSENKDFPDFPEYSDDKSSEVTVFSPETENSVSFEEYICGVVAAEMPAAYEEEALKAQAVAARTYAYKRLADVPGAANGLAPEEIESIYQAYRSVNELRTAWGDSFADNYTKISRAVKSTEGQIMVYDDEPIEAVFHSSSAGATLDAENVWNKEYPYLKSVASTEEDEIGEKRFERGELLNILRERINGIKLSDESFMSQFQVLSVTETGYILEAKVGNAVLTGRQIREVLGLKSAAITVSEDGGTVIFVTRGYGHGVGMSQSGANALAKSGYSYVEILEHYYKGISFDTISWS